MCTIRKNQTIHGDFRHSAEAVAYSPCSSQPASIWEQEQQPALLTLMHFAISSPGFPRGWFEGAGSGPRGRCVALQITAAAQGQPSPPCSRQPVCSASFTAEHPAQNNPITGGPTPTRAVWLFRS